MPEEFWREVVDRVAAEAPDTLLLAEAFWLMEGYFVRTLGMHRVYNSAFMNMLRDEKNAEYRLVIKNTLEFDPQILKRYVNFMNNPDERTAVDQFGKGDKYFGVATLMATMPGLPMFGHGQVEGYAENYGMEYRRAYLDEAPDAEPGRPPRARDLPAAAPALAVRRGRRLRALRLLHDRRRGQRGRLRLLQPGRAASARWSSTTTATPRRRADPESVGFMARDADGERRLRRESLSSALRLSARGRPLRPDARRDDRAGAPSFERRDRRRWAADRAVGVPLPRLRGPRRDDRWSAAGGAVGGGASAAEASRRSTRP